MKTMNPVVLVLVVGVLCFASAKHVTAKPQDSRAKGAIYANSLADGGRIRMQHSPVLGINISIVIWFDGQLAGPFTRGHIFERYLTPGRHTIFASRPMASGDSYTGTLDVRQGESYYFVLKVTGNHVILQPTGPFQ